MTPYIDMHCDTLLGVVLHPERELWKNDGMLDLSRMVQVGQMAQFFAVFFPPHNQNVSLPEDEELFQCAVASLHRTVEAYAAQVALASNSAEIRANHAAGKCSAVLTIEDGRMVQGDMERLCRLRQQGVTAIALTWNFANCFGSPNSTDSAVMARGLTDFGKAAIGEMNRLGMLVDVSHLSDGGFWDVAALSKKPFIASHSNCRAISPHPRNLTDEMIHTLADCGGVAGLNFCPAFLAEDPSATHTTVERLCAHVMHLYQVGGEDVIAMGTDFDGIDGTFEVGSPTEMYLLFDALQKAGLTPRQLEKFASENVLRVLDAQ